MGENEATNRLVAAAQLSPVTATAAQIGRLLIQLKTEEITG